ncbi:MAG: septal ring lytic transglycosylase RlpA family protein [Spirochaetaceae bacterium]|jgi:rare lipoprotein A|nr:septal ring lytic transglycosylase RlpA family protein [Spirochaetaceae bacterium]
MKRIITTIVIGLGLTALYASETQPVPGNGAFRQEGIASWYGAEFAGRPTASGEVFNPAQLTAAHPSLPFGTMLRITNKHNNKQVTVRVNDRGPFVSARIIDVSRGAAEVLDMISTGTAPVLVETLGGTVISGPPPTPSAAVPVQTAGTVPETPIPMGTVPQAFPARTGMAADIKPGIPPEDTDKRYRIQVGAYRVPRNAADAFEKLKNAGLNPAYERHDELYRVVLAGLRAGEVRSIAERLGIAGFQEALIREER